ncbi:MAG: nucleotidyltransferase domain-containing protein [Promethearchaeota archaeon]|nr:MAG: nucleotidyltransferase domain-containing protein [Candidatus Lokiarchaeota archaeon]
MDNHDPVDSLGEYSRYWRNKTEERKKNLLKREQLLKELAKKCSVLLKQKFNVKKVYLIGSLAREHRIHENSDIDLVVVGLSDKEYFSALRELYRLIPAGINIDLITGEDASKSMKNIIEKIGVLI